MSIEDRVGKYFHLFDEDRIRSIVFYVSEDVMLSLPQDENNSDFRDYLAWCAEGNEPEPWTPESETN